MSKLEPVLLQEKPDWVLVQGDTTTVMAAALLAYYHRIRIAHVEAGLRTHDKFNPFPEEINRMLTDVVADLYFAHTEKAKENLLSEGVNEEKIYVTGNTVIDALLYTVKKPLRLDGHLAGIPWDKRIILVTAHRRENFGKPLVAICHALLEIADSYPEAHIIYPVHPNPNVQEPVRSLLGLNGRISLLAPLDYLTFVHLMQRSYLILTDSGGLQEEAPSLGKPVLVLRQTTERPEAVQAGAARVVGTAKESITSHVRRLLEDNQLYERMASVVNPYGDGRASERIVRTLLQQ
jgi:UDP-N-acetylglucosamine 2-epimerase (non-hydrolysing)